MVAGVRKAVSMRVWVRLIVDGYADGAAGASNGHRPARLVIQRLYTDACGYGGDQPCASPLRNSWFASLSFVFMPSAPRISFSMADWLPHFRCGSYYRCASLDWPGYKCLLTSVEFPRPRITGSALVLQPSCSHQPPLGHPPFPCCFQSTIRNSAVTIAGSSINGIATAARCR